MSAALAHTDPITSIGLRVLEDHGVQKRVVDGETTELDWHTLSYTAVGTSEETEFSTPRQTSGHWHPEKTNKRVYQHTDTHAHSEVNHAHDNYVSHTHPGVDGYPHFHSESWKEHYHHDHAGVEIKIEVADPVVGKVENDPAVKIGLGTIAPPGQVPSPDTRPSAETPPTPTTETAPQPTGTAAEDTSTTIVQSAVDTQPTGRVQPTAETPTAGATPQQGPHPTEQSEPPTPEPQSPLIVTEYMVRDWSMFGGGGQPQWVEVYNPNDTPVNLDGYVFQYAARKFINHPVKIMSVAIGEGEIEGYGTAIFATSKIRFTKYRQAGISESQVYALQMPNVLKRGWCIKDAQGEIVHAIGEAFDSLYRPVAPLHQEGGKRVSHHVVQSEPPADDYYYGSRVDIGHPGFHEPMVPKAPTAPKVKKILTWGSLKKR